MEEEFSIGQMLVLEYKHLKHEQLARINTRDSNSVASRNLPASLRSTARWFDRAIGHHRRYTLASAREAIGAAGLDIQELRYVNPIGLLAWYVTMRTLGMTPKDNAMLRTYDRFVIPVLRKADRLPALFGQSVFAVATPRVFT